MLHRAVSRVRSYQPHAEKLESRQLLSSADGNGAVVTGLTIASGMSFGSIVLSFDGPLDATSAQNTANYRVNQTVPNVSAQFITTSGPADKVVSASYNPALLQVTLTLETLPKPNTFYRVAVNGDPSTGLRSINPKTTPVSTTVFDGDQDDTPAGDFYGLVAAGTRIRFSDRAGDQALLQLAGGGLVNVWRELNGDVDQVSLAGPVAGKSTLKGSTLKAAGSDGLVVLPVILGLTGVKYKLPGSFVAEAPLGNPTLPPAVATPSNLPYTLQFTQVPLTSVPTIQSGVYAQSGGKWLIIGGRTNGLHGFDPNGLNSFPPRFQNNSIIVVDPQTGQTWTKDWSNTDVPASVWAALASTNQQAYQRGDRLYTTGGYSFNANTNQFVTYDTLSSLSVSGLINAVINGGAISTLIKQIHDPRFEVTGGDMNAIGNRTFLNFGQDFQGGYNGNTASISQVYTDEIRSFQIHDNGSTLTISDYQAQRDPVNFRRRDGNLADSTILPNGKAGLTAFGGVFTVPAGTGYREPIAIGPNGKGTVNTDYLQYFNQYTSSRIGMYNASTRTMNTVFFGGISLYTYSFDTGKLTQDPGLPFVDQVVSYVEKPNGQTREFILPSIPSDVGPFASIPGAKNVNLYGANAAFFASPDLATYSNGILKLDQFRKATTLGYIYGGIVANQGNFGQTTASGTVFKVTIVPTA
jgi:hypothetical protein